MSASLRITVPLIAAYFITVVHHIFFFFIVTHRRTIQCHVCHHQNISHFFITTHDRTIQCHVCHHQNISQFFCNHSSQDHSVPRPSSPQRITVLSPRLITILPSQGTASPMTPHDPSSTPFPLITTDVSASLLISRHPQHPNLGPNEVKP